MIFHQARAQNTAGPWREKRARRRSTRAGGRPRQLIGMLGAPLAAAARAAGGSTRPSAPQAKCALTRQHLTRATRSRAAHSKWTPFNRAPGRLAAWPSRERPTPANAHRPEVRCRRPGRRLGVLGERPPTHAWPAGWPTDRSIDRSIDRWPARPLGRSVGRSLGALGALNYAAISPA